MGRWGTDNEEDRLYNAPSPPRRPEPKRNLVKPKRRRRLDLGWPVFVRKPKTERLIYSTDDDGNIHWMTPQELAALK